MMIPCDLLVTKDQRVFINGQEIGMVVAFDLDVQPASLTEVTLRFFPTSVVFGDPPIDGMQTSYIDKQGRERVDINKAIENARKRLEKKQQP